jgi:thiamine phosphate synthase YjbQ (UPF0047 family)
MAQAAAPIIHTTSLLERIRQLPDSAKWVLQHLQMQDNGEQVATAPRNGSTIAASDGSLKSGLGTTAFVIEDNKSCGRLKGVNKVPGPINEGDSHRCEVAGLYAIILMVQEVCSMHEIKSGKITVVCDNKTALRILDPNFLPDPRMKNFDLVVACWALKQWVPIEWKPKHVKGHQDQGASYILLPREARLNVEMDKTASTFWTHLMSCQEHPYPQMHEVNGEEWQLWDRETDRKSNMPLTTNALPYDARPTHEYVVDMTRTYSARCSKDY